jgi:fermentation-respiration switch protein FrsA (DUF1100 family)
MPSLVYVLAIFAVVYLLICALAMVFQPRLVYFPTRTLDTTPDRFGLPYRDVYFTTEDRVKLHGWFIPASPEHAVLLFFHGNGGNISHRLDSVRIFHDLGLSVFIIDYRGYGQSEGRTGEEGTYRDASAAWRHLVESERVEAERVVVFGRSLGGAIAVELASRVQPRAVILESTFTSAVELGARAYPWLPVRQLARIRYDSARRIGEVTCPKLFVHSLDDEVVPYGLGLRLYKEAGRPKELLKIRGGHGDGFLVSGRRYRDGIRDFLTEVGLLAPEPGASDPGPADRDL